MNATQLEWYLDSIRHEINLINDHDFVGNISFKINIKQGTLINMNVELAKSVKMPDQVNRTVSHIS